MDSTRGSRYSAPRLVVYGDVREITQNFGNSGTSDGGTDGGMMNSQA